MTISETKEFAERLAAEMPARIYALTGDLGAGKTAFSQFFLRAVGAGGAITSPTFVVMKPYPLDPPFKGKYSVAYHLDCYRLHDEHELAALDFEKVIGNPSHIVLLEWADRVRGAIPPDALWIEFAHEASDGERAIRIIPKKT